MQRIFPLPQKTAFLRAGALQVLPSISELGVYGTYLAYGTQDAATEGKDRWVEGVVMLLLKQYLTTITGLTVMLQSAGEQLRRVPAAHQARGRGRGRRRQRLLRAQLRYLRLVFTHPLRFVA
jgi:hypothetical protein